MERELSVRETAEALGVTSTAVYEMVKRDELTPVRVEMRGSRPWRYFAASAVEALRQQYEQRRTQGNASPAV